MLQTQGKRYIEFGPYRLDPAAGVVTRHGQLIALNPKAVETLAVLVRHHGQVVSKEELMKAVWPDAFVEEANLNVQVSALRKALGDSADHPAYIETIPRRGYRFLAEVRVVEAPAESAAATNVTETAPAPPLGSSGQAPVTAAPVSTRRVFAAAILIVMSIGVAGYLWQWRPQQVVGSTPQRFLVGVLPFANLSGDPEQEYLSDGLTEELITELARLNPQQLGVIARSSMMPYKGSGKRVREVAQELGLQYVLEGGVARAGNQLRVTVKLIQASDETQIWANDYERDFKDLIPVRRDVARAVARETFVRLTPEVQQKLAQSRSVSPKAYDAYLQGRFYWWMRTTEGYQRAHAYFEEALRIDPTFARAYAGMADLTSVYGLKFGDPRESARKAVELDPTLAEAHTSLAMAVWGMDFDWNTSEAHFRRALEIDPYYTPALHWYGFMLAHWGRHTEAIEQLERAKDTDPLNVVVLADLGQVYFWAGQYERGKETLHKAISISPKFYWSHYWMGRILEMEGKHEEALAEFELAEDQPLSRMDKNTAIACLYAKMGQPQKAREILRRLEKRSDFLPRNRALVYAALGEKDRALQILSNPGKYPSTALSAWVDPGFAALRTDPRFREALAKTMPPPR